MEARSLEFSPTWQKVQRTPSPPANPLMTPTSSRTVISSGRTCRFTNESGGHWASADLAWPAVVTVTSVKATSRRGMMVLQRIG
jgi:hypothetical protein